LTRPTDAKRTSEPLNPFTTNPLASWEFVLYWNILEGADVIDWPNTIEDINKDNMTK
jgi:hypothetical protein